MAITFKVGFQVDDKELKSGLAGIQNDIKNAFNIKGNMSEEIANATQQAMILEKALKRATTDKGISFYSLNSELRKAGSSATQLISTLTAGGDRFAASLNAANAAFATANRNVISLNSKIQEMGRVLTQSFKFTTAQAFLQGVSNAAREAYQWVYDLNKTITDISVVTGYQGEALDKVTQNAIAGARELRIAANEYAEGALIFYQQGLGDDEVARRVEITAKAARAAGSSLDEMSSQLTAIWNTYHMAGDEMERAASVGARMAADTAVDFSDIAEAMQTAAAPAEQMGVSYNSLAAIIATVGDTTQQSASVIGNAFKTIFSRFQQLRSEGTDGEVTLGAVSKQLQELGVNVLDAGGQLKSLDTVIAEVGNQWDDWSSKQQLAIAQLVGGTRQYGQFLTLMNNFDKYQDLLSNANLEDGSTLTQQYEASLDSIESRAENAAEAMNRAFSNLIDVDMLKGALGLVEDFGNVLGSLLESLNGIQGVGLIIAGIFNKQITQGIRNATANLGELWTNRNAKGRAKNINRDYDTMESDVNAQMSANQGNSAAMVNLNAQKQKLQYDRQIAIVNNEINTLMDKASGKFKIQLQQQQTYLTSLQQRRTAAIDELATLERQAEVSRQLSEQEQRRLQLALQRAQAEEADAQKEYDDVTAKLNGTDGGPAIKNRRNDDPEKQALLAQQAAASQKITQAQAKQIIIQEQLTQGTNDYDMAMQKLVKETASLINSGQKSDTIMAKVKTTFANLKGELKLSDSQIDSLTQSLDQLEQNFTPEKLAQFVAKIAEMGDTSKETTADIERLTSAAQEIQTTTNAMDDYQGRERTYDDESGPTQTPTPPEMNFEVDYASAFQNGTQAAMAFAGTLTTVIGASQMLMSVWSDEDASMSEKIMALVSALGMAIPTLTMAKDGLGSFKQMVLDLNPELAKLVTQQATATAATTGMSAAQQGVTATAGAMGTATTAAGAAATTAGTAGAAAGTSMAAAWAAALWPIVAIIAAVAAVGAAVAFVAGEIKNSSPEAQFERASEAAENLATAAEEAQTAAENLASTIEGYNSAVDTLNDCVQGTEEWEQALKHANEAALELIDNLPSDADLSGLYSRNERTGLIEFDQDKLAEVQKEADQKASQAEYAAQVGEVSVQQANNKVQQKNLSNSLSQATGYTVDYNTGQTIRGQSSSEISKIIEENIGDLGLTESSEAFKDALQNLGIDVIQTADELEPLWQQCRSLADGMQNAADKADLFAQMQVDEILGDSYSAEVKQITGEQLAANTEDWEQKYLGALTNGAMGSSEMSNEYGNIYQAQSKINDDLLAEYNALTGKNWVSSGNGVQGTDTNRIFEFINEEGEIVQLRAEQVAAEMAAAKALEEVTGSAEKAANALANIDSEYSEDFNKYITSGNFNSMTEDELNENFELGEDNKVTLESAREYAENVFGGESGLKEMVAATLGKSAENITEEEIEAYVQEIADGATTSFSALENVGSNLSKTAKDIFDDINVSGASVEAQQNFQQAFAQVYDQFGKEGAESFKNIVNQLSPEDAAKLAENIDEINWEDASPEYIRDQLEDLGISMDSLSDESLTNLIELMQTAGSINLDSATESFNKIKDATSGIESNTSTISEDQFQALQEAGIAADAYFQKMADGTYQLTMDADEFLQMAHDLSLKDMREVADTSVDRYNDLASLSNYSDSTIEDNTWIQRKALEATGSLTQGELDDLTIGNFDNYTEYAEAVRQAYAEANISAESIDQAMADAAEEASAAQQAIDDADFQFDVEQAGLDLDETSRYAERLAKDMAEAAGETDLSEENLKKYEKAARKAAIQNQKLDRGLKNLNDNLDDYKKVLKDSNKGTAEWSETMDSLKTDLADIVGFDDPDLLSDDFAEATLNSEDLQLALDGDVEAIQRLQTAAADDMIINIVANQSDDPQGLINQWTNLKAQFDAIPDLTAPGVDQTELINSFNQMIANGQMTKDQIEAALSGLHVSANVKTEYIAQKTTVPTTITEQIRYKTGTDMVDVDMDGVAETSVPRWRTETNTFEGPPKEVDGYVPKYTIEGTTDEGGNTVAFVEAPAPKPSYGSTTSGLRNNGGGGGSGGSSSTPTHSAKNASKYEPITDRYATIKSSIDEVQRSVDALSNAEDDAWGGDKVRNMQKINAELQRQGRNLQKLRKLALDYLDIDQGDAQIAAKDLITNLTEEGLPGLSLDKILFNSDGFVSNRTEITQQLNDYLESLYTPYYEEAMKYDRANSTDEAKAEEIDKLKEKYDVAKAFVDEFLAALDLVDETAQEAADALEQQLENIRTWMANKVEEATYKMEFKIGISDRDISLIEQAIDLWGDLGVKMGKTFDLLGNRLTEETSQFYNTLEHGNRMIEIIENIDPTNPEDAAWFKGEFGEEAWNEYISGNGGLPAEVLEAMQDDADSMIDYINSMYDTAEEMFGQYIEVLNMYMEEFDKIADKISANNDKLEMFQELLEFSGRRYTSAGRNSIRNIANASVDNAVLEVERATSALELAEQGAKETSQQLEDFLRDTNKDPSDFDEVEAFTYNQLKAAKDEADQILADAQSDMTSSIQDLASAAADAIEMVAEVIKEEVAANLGGDFASIDDMMTMYDQQYDLDTFFLRDFDKEYQLSSLLGEIEDQMEGITDPERLKEYESLIGEINDANQEGVDLTQTDVDLLKAKFEIQKAQDAYEEAQNAKNTMRLARDASGNWSYVYSADSENTEDAAQKLADAQYNYEKLLWEASDEASQYWLQAQQDFFQFQETIDWARYEHDEQYRAQIDKQLQYYQEKTELYAAQVTKYNDMLGVSFDETSLGVVTNMQDMESAQDWYTQQHEYYTNELNANTQHYQQVVADACNKVGISYDDLEEVVDDETQLMMKENDALRGTIEKLNTEGGRALSQLNTKVSQFRVKFVEDMKLATKALEEFLAKLEGYENESLDRMNYTGFDAYTDYTAAINNYVGEALQSGMTKEELMSDEGLKKLAYELGNKLNSDMLYELKHTTVRDRWDERTSYDAIDYMAGQIAEVMKKLEQGIWERWDEVDEWSEQHREEIQNYGKTASGGLIKTPQVRSLAEDGPELVLNSTDTQNILDAVKHMREVVKLKMSSMNSEIQKKTDGNAQKTIINKDVQQLDQQVHIDATFPNVSVAAEIEEAFNNLVNQAVQYASRK